MVTANENLMGTVSVSYLPAIQAAKQFSVSLEQLNVQLRNHQNIARQTGVITAAGLANQFKNQGVILDRYGRTLVDTNKRMETVTQAAQRQKKTVQDLANSHSFLQHRMGWFISGTAFYGAISAAGQAVKSIKDVEMGMVELARITDDVTFNFGKMRTDLLQLGIDYGRSWEEVQDVALRWAQAGYNVNDTLILTRSSLLALNTAELDAQNATQSMIGILSQWQLQAEDLLPVIDKINKTADDFAITSQDIVDGLLRSSGAAKVFGMSLEQTIGIITSMREASGRTGREVGNALNTILTYASRDVTINTLESAGIEVYANRAIKKLRPLYDILNDVNIMWNNLGDTAQQELEEMIKDTGLITDEMANAVTQQEAWNDLQKRDVSMSIAGTRRRTYLIALLQNYARAQEVINNMEGSLGYSMRENERTMEALEMKVKALRTAFTMLAVEIGEAGLLEVMKDGVDITRKMVEGFEKLPPELKEAIIMLGEMAAVMGIVNLAAKTFFSVDLIRKITAYTTATRAATIATGGLSAAFYAVPLWGQIALLTSLGSVIYSFASSAEEATVKAKRLMEQNTEAADKAKAQADEIERLSREYEKLADKNELTAEETNKFKTVTQQLTDLVPTAIIGFDEMGNAITNIGTASEEAAKKVAELRAEVARNAEVNALIAQNTMSELIKKEREAKEKLETVQSLYNQKNYRAILGGRDKTGASELDRLKWFTMGTNNSEWLRRSSELLKQASEEYSNATKAKLEAEKAIKIHEALLEGKDPFATAPTATGGNVVRGGGETPAQAYERLNEERQKLNHQMKIGEISQAQYVKSLKNIESQMRAAGVEERKIWSIQEELASLLSKGKTASDYVLEQQAYLQHQLKMGTISNEEYIASLEGIEKQLIAVGGKEKDVWSIQEEIYSLRTKENKKVYEDMYSNAMDHFNHETNLARMSRDEQIRYLRDLSRQHEWEKEKQWALEEQLFRLYQDKLNIQGEAIDKAYNDRIDEIERSAERRIARIQARIDALDEEQEGDDREEQERQHNEKVKELEQELRYHQLRTGAEHAEAIVEIEKKIEEERRRWKQQLDKWETDDRKRSLQRQIKDIQDAAREEKEVWKRKYQDIKKEWNKWSTEFAKLATDDPKWLEIGIDIGQQIVDGFSGSLSQLDGINFPGIGGQPGVDQELEKVKQLAKEQGGNWVYVNKDLYGKMVYWSGDTIRFSGGKGGVFTMHPDEYRALKEIDGVKVDPNYKPPSSGGGITNPPGGGDPSPSKSWHANWIDERYLTEAQKAAKSYALQQFGDLSSIANGENGLIEKISNATTDERIKQIKDYAKSIGIALNYFHSGLGTGIYTGGQRFDSQTESIAKMLLNYDPSRESLIKTLQDEVVLTKQQFLNIPKVFATASLGFNFEKFVTALRPSQVSTSHDNSSNIQINNLFSAEKVEFEDRTDMEIFARELKRQVARIK